MSIKLKREHVDFLRKLTPDDGYKATLSYVCPAKRSGACPSTHTLIVNLEDNNEILLTVFSFGGRDVDRKEITLEKSPRFTECELVEYASYTDERISMGQYKTRGYPLWNRDEYKLNASPLKIEDTDALDGIELELEFAIKQFQKDQQLPGRG